MKVCMVPYNVLWYPQGGGHAWVFINWTLGLEANGCEVVWLASLGYGDTPAIALQRLEQIRTRLSAVGLAPGIALLLSDEERVRMAPIREELAQLTVPWEAVVDEAELLLNFYYTLDASTVSQFKRTALVDIDPGLLQVWVSTGKFGLAPHDTYFTIGETVGTPEARFPDCGLTWQHTPPPVYLTAWPTTPADPTAAFTTVSDWWGDWLELDGEVFCNDKRSAFLEYVDLPSKTPAPLELAVCFGEHDDQERQLLEERGWRVRHAWDVTSTPEQYRAYIQGSRGEFSCAKASCMRLANAWISDRTLCYLASGKPAVVQHTGPSRFLPDAEGLFRFRHLEEAARYLETASADYERQCRLARALAEEHFDATKVTGKALERALT
jgi:hypothetical protein